jgi:hypothetical protein
MNVEILYHFSCEECKGWWSIAMENFIGAKGREWYCPWCGVKQYCDKSDSMGGRIPTEENK